MIDLRRSAHRWLCFKRVCNYNPTYSRHRTSHLLCETLTESLSPFSQAMACCQKEGTSVWSLHLHDRSERSRSHIAALLFTVEQNTQHQNMTTCTSLPCSWFPPSYHRVSYSEIADIDFATPQLNRTRGQS